MAAADIASAVAAVFEQQHHQSHQYPNKERFGDWNGKLAQAIYSSVLSIYEAADADGKYTAEYQKIAKDRAKRAAAEINDTTGTWVTEGKDEDTIWSQERAARIGDNEERTAIGLSQTVSASKAKRKLRWVTDPNCCPDCAKLNGRIRRAGSSFGVIKGQQVYNVPVHPACKCRTEEVFEGGGTLPGRVSQSLNLRKKELVLSNGQLFVHENGKTRYADELSRVRIGQIVDIERGPYKGQSGPVVRTDKYTASIELDTGEVVRVRRVDLAVNVLKNKSVEKEDEIIATGVALVAEDTGRALMLQRHLEDDNGGTGGKFEFPGGHVEEEEQLLEGAIREWTEEVGLTFPCDGEPVAEWTGSNGKYIGFIFFVPSEDDVDLANRDFTLNPDGDEFEAAVWVDPDDFENHNLRPELLEDVDMVRDAMAYPLAKSKGLRNKALISFDDLKEYKQVIAVDFNGTIAEGTGPDPEGWGEPIEGTANALQELQDAGYVVTINTCIGDTEAVAEWLDTHGVPYNTINESPAQPEGTSDKLYAAAYIDDRAIPFRGDWDATLNDLFNGGVLQKRAPIKSVGDESEPEESEPWDGSIHQRGIGEYTFLKIIKAWIKDDVVHSVNLYKVEYEDDADNYFGVPDYVYCWIEETENGDEFDRGGFTADIHEAIRQGELHARMTEALVRESEIEGEQEEPNNDTSKNIGVALSDVEGASSYKNEWTIRSGDDRKIQVEPKGVPGVGQVAYLSFSKAGNFGVGEGKEVPPGKEPRPGTLDFAHTLVDVLKRLGEQGVTVGYIAMPRRARTYESMFTKLGWTKVAEKKESNGFTGFAWAPPETEQPEKHAIDGPLQDAYELGKSIGDERREKSLRKQFERGAWKTFSQDCPVCGAKTKPYRNSQRQCTECDFMGDKSVRIKAVEDYDENTYLSYGHSGNKGDLLWWMDTDGTFKAEKADGITNHYGAWSEDWKGRYDSQDNAVTMIPASGRGVPIQPPDYVRVILSMNFPGAKIRQMKSVRIKAVEETNIELENEISGPTVADLEVEEEAQTGRRVWDYEIIPDEGEVTLSGLEDIPAEDIPEERPYTDEDHYKYENANDKFQQLFSDKENARKGRDHWIVDVGDGSISLDLSRSQYGPTATIAFTKDGSYSTSPSRESMSEGTLDLARALVESLNRLAESGINASYTAEPRRARLYESVFTKLGWKKVFEHKSYRNRENEGERNLSRVEATWSPPVQVERSMSSNYDDAISAAETLMKSFLTESDEEKIEQDERDGDFDINPTYPPKSINSLIKAARRVGVPEEMVVGVVTKVLARSGV